jgi:hypothetical protein
MSIGIAFTVNVHATTAAEAAKVMKAIEALNTGGTTAVATPEKPRETLDDGAPVPPKKRGRPKKEEEPAPLDEKDEEGEEADDAEKEEDDDEIDLGDKPVKAKKLDLEKDVIPALQQFVQKNGDAGKKKAKKYLEEFGVSSVRDLKEKDFAGFIAKCKA